MSEKWVILPFPPSINRYWRTTRNMPGQYKTAKAKSYCNVVHALAAPHYRQPFDGDVIFRCRLYRPRRSGDLDNYLKIVLDALEKVCYHNDKQVAVIEAARFDDKDNPRVEVSIESLEAYEQPNYKGIEDTNGSER